MKGKIYGVGVGPGDSKDCEARRAEQELLSFALRGIKYVFLIGRTKNAFCIGRTKNAVRRILLKTAGDHV